MDSSTIDTFFLLLRSGLYGSALPADALPRSIDWGPIWALAERQTVAGLVADAASRLPQEMQPPKKLMAAMFGKSVGIAKSHLLLDQTLAQLVGFYRRNGIEGVLLKGQGIARSYRNAQLRQCGDIDWYVGRENYQRSIGLALKELASGQKETSESVKHFHFNMGEVSVELHRVAAVLRTPFRGRRFEEWMANRLGDQSKLRSVAVNGTQVLVPSATFDAFFIFYHAWYHFVSGGIGLRQLCDWAMVLGRHARAIDRGELQAVLKRFGLMRAWQLLGFLLVERLGVEAAQMPFYNAAAKSKAQWALRTVLQGGNFGFYAQNSYVALRNLPFLKRKWRMAKQVCVNSARLFPLIPLEATCYCFGTLSEGLKNMILTLLGLRQRQP